MPEDITTTLQKIASSSSILVVIPPTPTSDHVAAALGLQGFLKKLEKEIVVVSPGAKLNQGVGFLPGFSGISGDISAIKSFVIDVSTKQTPLDELSYKKEGDRLSIFLKPKRGQFAKEDMSFRTSAFPYDIVITIGLVNLESLGEFYGRNAELFFETPIVNIDFKGANQNYGQFNLVELTASSVSEIVFDLIIKMEKSLIDEPIATTLLAGLISETNSFQHSRTTPQAFLKASELISLGGNQQAIVQQLYKSKSLGFLKLWGRVLARIKTDSEASLAYSAINQLDIDKSAANEDDVRSVIHEMQAQLTFAKIHLFIRETTQSSTQVFAHAPASINIIDLFREYSPEIIGAQAYLITIPLGLAAAEQTIVESIKKESQKLHS